MLVSLPPVLQMVQVLRLWGERRGTVLSVLGWSRQVRKGRARWFREFLTLRSLHQVSD